VPHAIVGWGDRPVCEYVLVAQLQGDLGGNGRQLRGVIEQKSCYSRFGKLWVNTISN